MARRITNNACPEHVSLLGTCPDLTLVTIGICPELEFKEVEDRRKFGLEKLKGSLIM
jgi:hypothetical protein